MILIVKRNVPPSYLLGRGIKQTESDYKLFDLCPDEYLSGKRRFPKFKNSIYNAKQVKKALLKSQFNKCCYCESKPLAPRDLAIEHFRPKSEVRQTRSTEKEYPGYYWLSYEWDNLLLSCHECNSGYKGILFPLANPHHRARCHHDDISLEQPLFIHPATQNPRKHIQFEDESPKALTPIGETTIEGLGLCRSSLRERRFEKLQLLKTFLDIVECAKKKPRDSDLRAVAGKAQEFLKAAILPDAEYSSMAQDFMLRRQVLGVTRQSA